MHLLRLRANWCHRTQKSWPTPYVIRYQAKVHILPRTKIIRHGKHWCFKNQMPTFKFIDSASIFGFSRSKFVLGGMTPFSNTMIVLMMAAIPAHPSRWPMLLFTAPLKPESVMKAWRIVRHQCIHVQRLAGYQLVLESSADSFSFGRVPNSSSSPMSFEKSGAIHAQPWSCVGCSN